MADGSPPQVSTAPILIEVCVDTTRGLRIAAEGADRIELCAALAQGGLTPSLGFMQLAAQVTTPVRAMIRPRAGDFTYSADEIDLMLRDIDATKTCGLAGVVLGANLPSGDLDEKALGRLVGHAKAQGLDGALHRGFDLAPDLNHALDVAIGLKADTILTSGGQTTAVAGVQGLASLVARAAGRIEILAGSGVTAGNVKDILASGVTAIHASCGSAGPERHDRAAELGYVSADQRDTDPVLLTTLRRALNRIDSTMTDGGRR